MQQVMAEVERKVNDKLMDPHQRGDEEEKPVPFECPMPWCGNSEYIKLTQSNGVRGPNGGSTIIGYECCGCSVRFGDPAKFSNIKGGG
ncbi:MAG: hypothetical protein G01um101413_642 [Parcubacteria group bacterium Gr01-1014_13]|nr:MAG: hypothetical protein G01um101413_642 [Parcubacteria group bacterium Gr01-1014_13]